MSCFIGVNDFRTLKLKTLLLNISTELRRQLLNLFSNFKCFKNIFFLSVHILLILLLLSARFFQVSQTTSLLCDKEERTCFLKLFLIKKWKLIFLKRRESLESQMIRMFQFVNKGNFKVEFPFINRNILL